MSISLVDFERLKIKDDALAAFKNYRALQENQPGC